MIETRFVVCCDRCGAELPPIRGETFASEDDARAAMASSGWEETSDAVACYGCADLIDDESDGEDQQ